jgi:hypothetical protein
MRALNYELKNLCQSARDGSHATQAARFQTLQLIGDQLEELGFRLPNPKSLKPKHIEGLVARWKAEGLAAGTLKNRMSHIRWWADKVGKRSILQENEAYGLEERQMFNGNRAHKLDTEKLSKIACPYTAMSLRLQAAFGLRREEALKFRPALADVGDAIVLKASWCKGGRSRVIPITHPRQRDILNDARKLAGNGSLIPASKSYIEHLRHYQYEYLRAGINNPHASRHAWAQWRYKQLSGMAAPAAGGTPRSEMTDEQKRADDSARLQVSQELGHGRIDITNVYLGARR